MLKSPKGCSIDFSNFGLRIVGVVECEAVEAVAVCAEDPVASDCNADLPAGDPNWGDWYD